MYIVCFVGDYGICTDSNNNVINIHRSKLRGYEVGDKIPHDIVAESVKANDKDSLDVFGENDNLVSKNDFYVFDDVIIELNLKDKTEEE